MEDNEEAFEQGSEELQKALAAKIAATKPNSYLARVEASRQDERRELQADWAKLSPKK